MNYLYAAIAGVLGALIGAFAFDWLLSQGLYAMILPGALLGTGVGLGIQQHNLAVGFIAGVAALSLGVYLEWIYLPFIADESFSFFMQNITQIDPAHLIMILAGGFAGFWFGQGRHSMRSGTPNEQK